MKIIITAALFVTLLAGFYYISQQTTELSSPSLYNPQKALDLTYMAMIAYCDPSRIEKQSCGPMCNIKETLSDVIYFQKQKNLGYMGYNARQNSIQIAFRGTVFNSITNWIENSKVLKTSFKGSQCKGCNVHLGFHNSYLRLLDQFDNLLFNYYLKKYPNAKIELTGHSLGGALATLFAAHLYADKRIRVESLITVGSPMVGNVDFVDWFDIYVAPKNNFRISNYADPVQYTPGATMKFDHVGYNVYYKSGSYSICLYACTKYSITTKLSIAAHSNYFQIDWDAMSKGNCDEVHNEQDFNE